MSPSPTARRALIAVILSGLAPGAGHLYLGRPARALAWVLLLGLSLLWWSSRIPVGLLPNLHWLLIPCLLTLGLIFDSARLSFRTEPTLPRNRLNNRWFLASLILAFTVLSGPLFLKLLTWQAGVLIATDMSMAPVISRGDWLVHDRVERSAPRHQRGELLVLQRDGGSALVRRLIALPGDRVSVKNGLAFVEGKLKMVHFPRLLSQGSLEIPELKLAAGQLFVLSDARRSDDPLQGVIPEGDVLGQPSYVLWPGQPDDMLRLGASLR